MTVRLYYTDAMLREFDGVVMSCRAAGDRFDVELDRTAFYPASGGQPFDTGRLGGARVLEVIDRDDGGVSHVVDTELQTGERVHGAIDWTRRLDHMQQHTGQHVLSAAFARALDVRTVSFHLGAETATIDLAREVTPAEIARAELDANRVVWEDRPVTVRFASSEEAAVLPLRKESARTGQLRLVEVTDFDLSACGGTHVPGTGMIGVIAVAGWERFKGTTRLTFLCGERALRSYGSLRDIAAAASRVIGVGPADLAAGVERQQADLKAAMRTIRRLEGDLGGFRAEEFRRSAETIGPYRCVLMPQPGDAQSLKTLASAIVSGSGMIVVFTGDGQPTPVVVARSADVSFDASAWMRDATSALGGRGGGRPELAQGGLNAPAERVLEFARRALV